MTLTKAEERRAEALKYAVQLASNPSMSGPTEHIVANALRFERFLKDGS
jgi:hypothetical protein